MSSIGRIGCFTTMMIGIGAIISVFFPLFGIMVRYAGVAAPLVIILLGGLIFLTVLHYAEMASAIPEAGGGYIWIHKYLGEKQGFATGWLSWFAHSVACAAYAIASAFFLSLLLESFMPRQITGVEQKILALVLLAIFTFINIRGVKSTGYWGNVVTGFVVAILLAFIGGGIAAIVSHPHSFIEGFSSPLPQGVIGLFAAMGIFVLAYTGSEIVVQAGEEMQDPKKDLPKALIWSFLIVLGFYLLVSLVAIGGLVGNIPSWKLISNAGERALIEAGRSFLPTGNVIIIIGGLFASLAALNTTIFSSSHVSFAMSRNLELPKIFAPPAGSFGILQTNRTVLLSAILIALLILALPLKDVASAADIVFIILFLQVHFALIAMRKKEPDLERPFKVPLYPWTSLIAVSGYSMLLLRFTPLPWFPSISPLGFFTVLVWAVAGAFLYLVVKKPQEQEHFEQELVFEEVLHFGEPGTKKILMPFTDSHDVAWRLLMRIGLALAREMKGDLYVLRINEAVKQESLAEERRRFRNSWPPFRDEATRIAEDGQAEHIVKILWEVHRDAAQAILETVMVLDCDYLLLGWKGYTLTKGRVFGKTIDQALRQARCNLVVVKLKDLEHMKRILVPTAGGAHSRIAGKVAAAIAHEYGGKIHVLRIIKPGTSKEDENRFIKESKDGLRLPDDVVVEGLTKTHNSIPAAILEVEEAYDVVVLPAGREGFFSDKFVGNTGRVIMENSTKTAILVKHHVDLREPIGDFVEKMKRILKMK